MRKVVPTLSLPKVSEMHEMKIGFECNKTKLLLLAFYYNELNYKYLPAARGRRGAVFVQLFNIIQDTMIYV